ncbi:hypothetical protein [uncultured Lamprocystis sp.]|jgi:hypothetical protein|uniref:hypothetical protein n=1 Tax=uncultured Lamprocystis sp. TaxID=543132 RepID=UPI0025CBA150|nr:hypothetical protein [uncultured Lamprocystis sp.]
MKFPHLPLGQRFVYQDERYTKTGPMTASRERDGAQRMIPRSAAVLPGDAATREAPAAADPGGAWQAALNAYEMALRRGLGPLDLDLEERFEASLATARAVFIAAIR